MPARQKPSKLHTKTLFDWNKDDLLVVKGLHSRYGSLRDDYFTNAFPRSAYSTKELEPFKPQIIDMTKMALQSGDERMALVGNILLNELQSDMVYGNHEKKMQPTFKKAHRLIDDFMATVPHTPKTEKILQAMAFFNNKRDSIMNDSNLSDLAEAIAPQMPGIRFPS